MKNFIRKNLGYIILSMMLIGMFGIGLGLDWDQSQIAWRGQASGWVIGAGSVLFVAGIALLVSNTGSGG